MLSNPYFIIFFLFTLFSSSLAEACEFKADNSILSRNNPLIQDFDGEIKVNYVHSSEGSLRVGEVFVLPCIGAYSELSFDVFFPDDFDWGKGGKLHGLSGSEPVTGGSQSKSGWSARVSFYEGGRCALYFYEPQRGMVFGSAVKSDYDCFEHSRWHHVSLKVRLLGGGRDEIILSVDDVVVEATNLRLVDHLSESLFISKFLFSTFHGGNNPSYTPCCPDEAYETVYFKNFEVYVES